MSVSEMSKLIHSIDHPEIKDWPKRPYKTIVIVFMLLFSGILFVAMGIYKFFTDHTYDIYVPNIFLGLLLLIPGLYYSIIFILILIGADGWEYSELPDLSQT
jgi:hypothetical protein